MFENYENQTTTQNSYPETPNFIQFLSECSAYLSSEVTTCVAYNSQKGQNLNTKIKNFHKL